MLNAAARVITGTRRFDRGLGQILHDQLHRLDVPDRVLFIYFQVQCAPPCPKPSQGGNEADCLMSQGTTTLDDISKFCMKFGHLILRKIIKLVATRCQIFRLKCTKFDFGCGSAPDPAGGAYIAPPGP